MELTSSKLRLSPSVSSDIDFRRAHLKKKQIVLIVLFIGVISASGGFLLGYFLKGNKNNVKEDCPGKDQNQQSHFDDEEAFRKFKKEVSTAELRENLRYENT